MLGVGSAHLAASGPAPGGLNEPVAWALMAGRRQQIRPTLGTGATHRAVSLPSAQPAPRERAGSVNHL